MTGPKEGIYLDAALAVIGEQLEERIDELSRRRRTRKRLGVAALSVFALASGSVAAVALSSAVGPEEQVAVTAMAPEHTVQCIEGDSARQDAYFTVRYRVEQGVTVDAGELCARAWTALASDADEVREATPEELMRVAAGYVSGEATDAAATVVSDASFGRLAAQAVTSPPSMLACPREDETLVLAPPVLPTASADRLRLCAQAGA